MWKVVYAVDSVSVLCSFTILPSSPPESWMSVDLPASRSVSSEEAGGMVQGQEVREGPKRVGQFSSHWAV